jgi:hypothetical protein
MLGEEWTLQVLHNQIWVTIVCVYAHAHTCTCMLKGEIARTDPGCFKEPL